MYNDDYVWRAKDGDCALLIEPRSICPKAYEYVEHYHKKFKCIFTHDSKILSMCDNAKLILWGWGNANYMSYSDRPKTKNISIVSSDKELCELHKARKELALLYEGSGLVDCYGTFNGGKFASVEEYMADYRYSIVIENYIDDYWFTEKILNCFANKVVPIYFGARKIDEFFNSKGIIHCNSVEEIKDVVKSAEMLERIYESARFQGPIIDNYNRVQNWSDFETMFFDEYGELLNEC
jgi:hypothetical protein